MPALDGHIFLGYDPNTGNPTYYPAIPTPTAAWYPEIPNPDAAWLPTTADPYAASEYSHVNIEAFPSVAISDSDGILNYLVPMFSSAVLSHLSIALQPNLYDWANTKVVEAGYPALNGKTYLTVGEDQFRLSVAYNVATDWYDLIAFETTVELSEGETVATYTSSVAIFIAALPPPGRFSEARFVI